MLTAQRLDFSSKKADFATDLVEVVARQMEISAEFSDGFFWSSTGLALRLHEFERDPLMEKLIQSGEMKLIPTITSQDLYLWMGDFIGEIEESALKRDLGNSLKGVSAVWRFRNILYKNEKVSRQWELFKTARLRQLAQSWLQEYKI